MAHTRYHLSFFNAILKGVDLCQKAFKNSTDKASDVSTAGI